MNEIFTDELIALQSDPHFFSPQKLDELKRVFDRVSREAGISLNQKAQRDRLATIIMVASALYSDEESLVKAALKAYWPPGID